MRRFTARVVSGIMLAACVGAGVSATAGPVGASVTGYAQIIRLGNMGGPSNCQFAFVDVETGTVTAIGPELALVADGCPFDMAFRADGRLYGVLSFGDAATPSQLVTIDPTTGARTSVGSLGFATYTGGLAFDAAGTLWYYALKAQNGGDPNCPGGADQSCLYRLDPATGTPSLVGGGGMDDQLIGATATCTAVLGNQLVPSMGGPPSGQLVTLNTTTAAFSAAPNPYNMILMTGIEMDTSGVLHGLAFAFDPGTGAPQSPATYIIDGTTGIETKTADITTLDPDQILGALAIPGPRCQSQAVVTPAVQRTPAFTG